VERSIRRRSRLMLLSSPGPKKDSHSERREESKVSANKKPKSQMLLQLFISVNLRILPESIHISLRLYFDPASTSAPSRDEFCICIVLHCISAFLLL